MRARLWPHPELQLKRDPKLASAKSDDNVRQLNLATGALGPAPSFAETDRRATQCGFGGELLVRFDAHPLPVLEQRAVLADYEPPTRALRLSDAPAASVATAASAASAGSDDTPPPAVHPALREDLRAAARAARKAADDVAAAREPDERARERLAEIARADPLMALDDAAKRLLWEWRAHAAARAPRLLAPFLRSAVDWTSRAQVHEARALAAAWARAPDDDAEAGLCALELLDARFGDPVVRERAAREVDARMRDAELAEVLLQLVQALKFERAHDSPLARVLLRRALRAPNRIGHPLFWLLRSEMHVADACERYGVLLACYLANAGEHLGALGRQVEVNTAIQEITERVVARPDAEQLEYARAELERLNPRLPAKFAVCISPRVECAGVLPRGCRVMDSKKKPLWLEMENADARAGERVVMMFKAGDDLRQDALTLQLLRVMDRLWRAGDARGGLDLRLKPYGCAATGKDLGMIEIVKSASTVARIQTRLGGGALGALRKHPVEAFLRKHNAGDHEFAVARENFIYSCAGYCVATYVLGIGDRHADNIMVTNAGHLFHIDFGHFLGNFKSKFGIKRERAPFVFTPDFAYVLGDKGSDDFNQFVHVCGHAYNVIRASGHEFINLFQVTPPTTIPDPTPSAPAPPPRLRTAPRHLSHHLHRISTASHRRSHLALPRSSCSRQASPSCRRPMTSTGCVSVCSSARTRPMRPSTLRKRSTPRSNAGQRS